MATCKVPLCLSQDVNRSGRCRLHQRAALAEEVGCADRRCVACRRAIKKTDFVYRQMVPIAHRRKAGETHVWQHVACEPKTTRPSARVQQESVKPLLAGLG